MTKKDYKKNNLKGQFISNALSCYETFVREKLGQYLDTWAAQIHDYLKEHHSEFLLPIPAQDITL
jgi:hypothetical protein